MNITEYTSFDALGLADLVRRGEVTPSELMSSAFAAIEQVNPQINAVITSLREQAEREVAVGLPGVPERAPFRGVPFLIKDLVLWHAGSRTGMGSRLFVDFVAPWEAELMARYRRAGLVTLGKTNTPEFGFHVVTEPVANGPTRNPWRTDRTPGGSSGGSAAAVAARMVPAAYGNDCGGSIRIPASCCGLFGLKPTRARTPSGPVMGEVLGGLGSEHVLTRSVRDSAALLDATAGEDPGAPYFPPPPARPYLEEARTPPGRLRIAFTDAPWNGVEVSPACKEALRRAVALCEELGHEVVPARPELDWRQCCAAFNGIIYAYQANILDESCPALGLSPGPESVEAICLAMADRGRKMSAVEHVVALGLRDAISRQVGQFFTPFDALLSPTLAAPPIPLGAIDANDAAVDPDAFFERCFEFAAFTPVFNLSGNPAMSVPLHTSEDGLPIGVQFVGRYGDEATLFRLAGQLEQAAPWADRRPAVCAG